MILQPPIRQNFPQQRDRKGYLPINVFRGAPGPDCVWRLASELLQLTYICEDLLRKKGFHVFRLPFQVRRLLLQVRRLPLAVEDSAENMRCRLLLSAGMEAQMRPMLASTTVSAKAWRAAQVAS